MRSPEAVTTDAPECADIREESADETAARWLGAVLAGGLAFAVVMYCTLAVAFAAALLTMVAVGRKER